MAHPESQIFYLKRPDKISGERLYQAYPCWSDFEIPTPLAEKIKASADFKGILTKRGSPVRYKITPRKGESFEAEANVPVKVGRSMRRTGYEYEARGVIDASERRLGKSPLTGILEG